MTEKERTKINVTTTVNAPVEKVWELWTNPKHITQRNSASEDWHSPRAENDLRPGGKFLCRMEAKDGSSGFDFTGVYDEIKMNKLIAYTMDDGRKVTVTFETKGDKTHLSETFEAESTNPAEMQKDGWQSILENFRQYAESK